MVNKRITHTPLALQLFLTKKCNLKCVHCSADEFLKKEMEPELNTKEWIYLLERLKEIQVFEVAFSGGEVFLRKDIFTILENTVKLNFPKIRLTTNGTLISDEVARQIKILNFKNIEISLDGDRETHDQIRGIGSFAKTVEGIGHLLDNAIIPSIRFTPLKNNYRKLKELVDMLLPLGINKISFNTLHPTGRCNKIFADIRLDCFVDAVELQKILNNLKEKHCDMKISNIDTFYNDLPVEYDRMRKFSKTSYKQKLKPCSAGHSSCNITASGWVIPCSELFDFKGGNIRDNDILDIWRNSEAFTKIRNLSNISTGQIPHCKNCNYNVLCSSGCRADAYAVYGDLLAPDPFCPYWKNEE